MYQFFLKRVFYSNMMDRQKEEEGVYNLLSSVTWAIIEGARGGG